MRSAAERKAIVAGARGKGAWGGVGWARTSGPTSKERGGEVGRKRDIGDDATGRGARVVPGREWRGGREGGGEPPFPPDPYSARWPPPSRAAPHPLPPERPLGPTPTRGAPPSRRFSLPTFPSRAARLEERLTRRAGKGEAAGRGGAGRGGPTAPLSEPTTLKILPQVDLRKPCQLICL